MRRFRINGVVLFALFITISFGVIKQYKAQAVPLLESEGAASELIYLPFISNFKVPQVSFEPYVSGFSTNTITGITNAGDGRLYVLEREGRIRIVEPDGTLVPTPFLNITHLVASSENWELGLLGLAFHPNYPATPQLFVTYTRKVDFRIVVSRFNVSPGNLDEAIVSSEALLITLAKVPDVNTPSGISPVHNGGDMSFGPDGYLYVGFGDSGPDPLFGSTVPHDPANNRQRIDKLLGKIIRIDVNPNTPGNHPPQCGQFSGGNYSIPPDNPLVGNAGCNEIWASGLRNPWRMSFDSLTGDMYIGDVGEWIFEEIDFIPAGESGYNFGWRCWEGTFDQTVPHFGHPVYAANCGEQGDYDFPIFEYDSATAVCAVTGGYVYRGTLYEDLQGFYLLGDFCTGEIWALKYVNGIWASFAVGNASFLLSTFGQGADGELYAGGYQSDTIYKVVVP